jgi:hypothetical protein
MIDNLRPSGMKYDAEIFFFARFLSEHDHSPGSPALATKPQLRISQDG